MGQCNGFRSRLWQSVRTFTVKLVKARSELLCTKFVGKDTTRRTTPREPITHLKGYSTMVKVFKESHAKDVKKLAADRVREAEKKAKDNAVRALF
jgi:hypothetical protein